MKNHPVQFVVSSVVEGGFLFLAILVAAEIIPSIFAVLAAFGATACGLWAGLVICCDVRATP